MTSAKTLPGGTFQLGGPDGQPGRVRRDAAGRAWRLRAARRPGRGGRRAARGGRARHHAHRHLRLLRPVHHQRDHPRGPRTRTRTTCTSSPRSARCATTTGRGRTRARPRTCARRARESASTSGSTRWTSSTCGVGGIDRPEPGRSRSSSARWPSCSSEGLIRHLGRQHGQRRADRRSAGDRAGRVRAEPLQRRPPGRRRARSTDRRQGIAYVPYFPLGGFSPLQSDALDAVAARLGSTPMAVALAWLLRRSPNILLIPGTSSVAHLRENVASASPVAGRRDARRN